ncbi:anaerobic ribonucleoside-triphosphate reductase activating protein [Candidatus Bipolaricaulota bacterium]
MIVGGVQWTTLLDYPDHIAATVFTAGCNFRCPFCHNPELVLPELVWQSSAELDESFFTELETRKDFLDAIVISGGEPTLQPDLREVLARIKGLGYLIKLDTNGSRPDLIQSVLESGWVDFVAMDIKAPPDAYDELSGSSVDISAIEASMATIARLAPRYEFRTTVAPGLSQNDLIRIGDWIESGQGYWLQEFQEPIDKALVDEGYRDKAVLKKDDLEAVWDQLRDRFDSGGVRG